MPDLFIDGAWTAAAEGGTREIRCPADGALVRVVDEATAVDTNRAIEAALVTSIGEAVVRSLTDRTITKEVLLAVATETVREVQCTVGMVDEADDQKDSISTVLFQTLQILVAA